MWIRLSPGVQVLITRKNPYNSFPPSNHHLFYGFKRIKIRRLWYIRPPDVRSLRRCTARAASYVLTSGCLSFLRLFWVEKEALLLQMSSFAFMETLRPLDRLSWILELLDSAQVPAHTDICWHCAHITTHLSRATPKHGLHLLRCLVGTDSVWFQNDAPWFL